MGKDEGSGEDGWEWRGEPKGSDRDDTLVLRRRTPNPEEGKWERVTMDLGERNTNRFPLLLWRVKKFSIFIHTESLSRAHLFYRTNHVSRVGWSYVFYISLLLEFSKPWEFGVSITRTGKKRGVLTTPGPYSGRSVVPVPVVSPYSHFWLFYFSIVTNSHIWSVNDSHNVGHIIKQDYRTDPGSLRLIEQVSVWWSVTVSDLVIGFYSIKLITVGQDLWKVSE